MATVHNVAIGNGGKLSRLFPILPALKWAFEGSPEWKRALLGLITAFRRLTTRFALSASGQGSVVDCGCGLSHLFFALSLSIALVADKKLCRKSAAQAIRF